MGATAWQKVSSVDAIICVATQWKSLFTWTDLSNDQAMACHKRLRECHLSVDTYCKAHGVLALCACSNHTDHDLVKNCPAYYSAWLLVTDISSLICECVSIPTQHVTMTYNSLTLAPQCTAFP